MNLLWFENLLLMRLWVWNVYLVLLWNRALAYPQALLPSGGPLSREFWQLTTPLNSKNGLTHFCGIHIGSANKASVGSSRVAPVILDKTDILQLQYATTVLFGAFLQRWWKNANSVSDSRVPPANYRVHPFLSVIYTMIRTIPFNPWSARSNHLNFYPLEVVSRYRDPQLQVGEN